MGEIFFGTVGSLLAIVVIWVLRRTRPVVAFLGSDYRLAQAIRKGGIRKFHFSRDDYEGTMRTYLSKARQSIDIVSISLKQTHDQGDLVSLFRQRLAGNPNFRIRISLLRPKCSIVECAATSLDISPEQLDREIQEMLGQLTAFKNSLPPDQQLRLDVLVHDALPMGSAILLDASPTEGTIQIETKLHRTPRVESFGFEIVGGTAFFGHHHRAWTRLLNESRPPAQQDLV